MLSVIQAQSEITQYLLIGIGAGILGFIIIMSYYVIITMDEILDETIKIKKSVDKRTKT